VEKMPGREMHGGKLAATFYAEKTWGLPTGMVRGDEVTLVRGEIHEGVKEDQVIGYAEFTGIEDGVLRFENVQNIQTERDVTV
jgi:hypothetical protein